MSDSVSTLFSVSLAKDLQKWLKLHWSVYSLAFGTLMTSYWCCDMCCLCTLLAISSQQYSTHVCTAYLRPWFSKPGYFASQSDCAASTACHAKRICTSEGPPYRSLSSQCSPNSLNYQLLNYTVYQHEDIYIISFAVREAVHHLHLLHPCG
jgi:hypothetical protein